MIGRMFNTLRFRLRKDLEEWEQNNRTLQHIGWSRPHKLLIAAGTRPIWVPVTLTAFVLAISMIVGVTYSITALIFSSKLSISPETLERFFALWGTQASIAALIYPIVIGFVALLLQRRYSAKAKLYIYLHDSSAILTGISALFLVLAMGFQFYFLPFVDESAVQVWLIVDGVWFLVNVAGLIWFLIRTFEFLQPDRRATILLGYAINHILPSEIRCNLQAFLFSNSVVFNWLPGPMYGDDKSRENVAVLPSPIGGNMGELQISATGKEGWLVRDVRFRLLAAAVNLWKARELRHQLDHPQPNNQWARARQSSLIIFPTGPGDTLDPKVGLCRTENSLPLSRWESLLIQCAFSLEKSPYHSPTLSITTLLNDLITDAAAAMQANEETAFEEVLNDIVMLHGTLISAGNFTNDSGRKDNYSMLPKRGNMFGEQMHRLWIREYQSLLTGSVEKLSSNDVYFRNVAYVPGWLISDLGDVGPQEILIYLLSLSRFLHFKLNQWWSRQVEEQGNPTHGACQHYVLRPPLGSVYESSISNFVGVWESLQNYRFPPARDKDLNWDEICRVTDLYLDHVEGTAVMMFDCVKLGNTEGSELLCDGLVKWSGGISSRFGEIRHYVRDERMLTIELTNRDWAEAKQAIDLSLGGNEEKGSASSLWVACIHNYWVDLCCIAIYTLIQLGKDCACENSLPARLIPSIALGKPLRAGSAGIGAQAPIRDMEDLLLALLRQFFFDSDFRSGYRARLDKITERISGIGSPAMIPGRVYTGSGRDDLDALRDGQLIFLCLFIPPGWTPSARLIEISQKRGIEDDANLRRLVDKLKAWREQLSKEEFRSYSSVFTCIQSNLDRSEKFSNAIDSLSAGLGQLVEKLETFRAGQLRDAKISEKRLNDIVTFSSKSGFSKATGGVPVSLFNSVRHSKEPFSEYSLTISEMNKGEFVDPPMAPRAANEDEWLDGTVSSHVAATVMFETLRKLRPRVIDVADPFGYWKQLKIASHNIDMAGDKPILLVARRTEPHWLLNWLHRDFEEEGAVPEDLRFSRDKQFSIKEYLGSFNDIPVFVAPISSGSSVVLSLNVFDELTFTEFDGGKFVQASWKPTVGKEDLIDLRLSWRFDFNLKMTESFQLRYGSTKEVG